MLEITHYCTMEANAGLLSCALATHTHQTSSIVSCNSSLRVRNETLIDCLYVNMVRTTPTLD